MANAKNELLKILGTDLKIKCAEVKYGYSYDNEPVPTFKLHVLHSNTDLELFLNSLDFEYDSGFGGQELFGNVWLKDGTWLERGEYDGSEWWEHKVCPIIPEHLT